jgi:hypothetical protein
MWKYIVLYCLITWTPEPCPDKIEGCLVNHERGTVECGYKREFSSRDSAIIFRDSLFRFNMYEYNDIKLDSMLIKKQIKNLNK